MTSTPTRRALCLLTITSTWAIAQPDLIVSEIPSATTFGVVDGTIAYSFGTTVCNIGDADLTWNDSHHPIVSQTIYRLANGQIQQIGLGLAHHPTPPLPGNACGLGCSSADWQSLGAGCSSTSSSVIHGAQGTLGPRSEVNPFTGFFPFPFTSMGQSGDAIYKRVQVSLADISDPIALYFVETQVISESETTPQTKANNVSYRQVIFMPATANASMIGPTYTQQPAIFAWRDHGNGIGMPDTSVYISENTIPGGDEIFMIGSKATSLGTDHWRYDYAIYNMNGQRGIRELDISWAADPNAILSSTQFQSPAYHDDVDQQILNTPWTIMTDGRVRWFTESFAQNEFANAIRWGTMSHFGFEVNTFLLPEIDVVSIGFFGVNEPNLPGYAFPAFSPPHSDHFCTADLNGDGALNFFDISAFLGFFSAGDLAVDFNGDGTLNFFDISAFLNLYGAGCP